MNYKKINENQSIEKMAKELFRSLSGLGNEAILMDSLKEKGEEVISSSERNLKNIKNLENFIKENDFEEKSELLRSIKDKIEVAKKEILPTLIKILEQKNVFKDRNLSNKDLLEVVCSNIYRRSNNLHEKYSFKEYENEVREIINGNKTNDTILFNFFEEFRNVYSRISNSIFEANGIDKLDYLRKVKLSLSDLYGVDMIKKNSQGKFEIVDIKSSNSKDIFIEEYSDKRNDSVGWLKDSLSQKIIVADFKNTSNESLNKLKDLMFSYREAQRENDKEKIVKLVSEYNEIIENLDIKNINIESKEYDMRKIQEIKEYFDNLKKQFKDKFDKKEYSLQNEKAINPYITTYVRRKNERDSVPKMKNIESEYQEIKEGFEKSDFVVVCRNEIINKTFLLGYLDKENKFHKIGNEEININDSAIQSDLQGFKQKNISQGFKIREKSFEEVYEKVKPVKKTGLRIVKKGLKR